MVTAIQITHEAIQKFGGIGTVLHGLIISKKYQKHFKETLLYTPLFHYEGEACRRLGENSELLYSGLDGFDADGWGEHFSAVEKKYGVHIIYGKKNFYQSRKKTAVDIIAVDIWSMPDEIVNGFKYRLWEAFGIESDGFRSDRDYEQYLRIGIVLKDIFEALYGSNERAVVFSHEYMGMPSALAFALYNKEGSRSGDKTVFYAHEVSTARVVVEDHPGHDLTFYNVLNIDKDAGTSLEQTFGSFAYYSRNELVKRTGALDYVFAVSDITKEELLYLCPDADRSKIKVVYNGIPIEKVDYKEKERSTKLVQNYCENLYNFRPDYIFTHVTRLITSKALWRDISFLYHLDEHFSGRNLKGFFLILSTLVGDGRPPDSIHKMQADYGWPVVHREGWPDLVGAETDIYNYLEMFNARSRAIKGVFLNQFGFNKERCGDRVPEGASVLDIRLSSDIEFGLSIYEPFGIAQLETMPYGGLPVLSNTCGCAGMLKQHLKPNEYLSIDFSSVPAEFKERLKSKNDFLRIDQALRDQIEMKTCSEAAPELIERLPKNNAARKCRFEKMQKISRQFDWEHVAERLIQTLF